MTTFAELASLAWDPAVRSDAQTLAVRIASASDPHAVVDALVDELGPLEASRVWHEWSLWARPAQLAPPGAWSSWGQLTGKGWGKNMVNARAINSLVASGQARCIGLCGQTEDRTRDMMVFDPDCGLIATSPPWARAVWKLGHVEWPNGAVAYLYSPESSGAIHGHSHDTFWASEIHVWPQSSMIEAWNAIDLGVRKGDARLIWDSNPRPRHPIIRELLDRADRWPDRHRVTRGSVWENAANLNLHKLEEWYAKWSGTAFGRQWLGGEQLEESEGALYQQAWIDRSRRVAPARFRKRVLAIDPAISTRDGCDATGMIEAGLGDDGQIYVLADYSAKHDAEAWATLAIDTYIDHALDVILVERNRGGDLPTQTLRAVARERGLRVEVVSIDAIVRHTRGVVYVKELHSRGDKETRAIPTTPLYEQGQVSHVVGVDLGELEIEMCTFVPGPRVVSPNRLDALVFALWELADLGREGGRGARANVRAAAEAAKLVRPATHGALAGLGGAYRYGQGKRL